MQNSSSLLSELARRFNSTAEIAEFSIIVCPSEITPVHHPVAAASSLIACHSGV